MSKAPKKTPRKHGRREAPSSQRCPEKTFKPLSLKGLPSVEAQFDAVGFKRGKSG